MKILGPADFRIQPWANGRGQTVEMLRIEDAGRLVLRLSMATVAEDGDFSIFPDVDRVLTVLSGPGFRLTGAGLALICAPLVPVAFPGDVPVRAEGTGGQVSTDFNVMRARGLPPADVAVLTGTAVMDGSGAVAVYAIAAARVNGLDLPAGYLAQRGGQLDDSRLAISGGPVIVVRHPL